MLPTLHAIMIRKEMKEREKKKANFMNKIKTMDKMKILKMKMKMKVIIIIDKMKIMRDIF
jgi:amino acid permease